MNPPISERTGRELLNLLIEHCPETIAAYDRRLVTSAVRGGNLLPLCLVEWKQSLAIGICLEVPGQMEWVRRTVPLSSVVEDMIGEKWSNGLDGEPLARAKRARWACDLESMARRIRLDAVEDESS